MNNGDEPMFEAQDEALKASSSPKDWAYTPDPSARSTWLLPIDTDHNLSLSLEALSPANQHGELPIPPEAMPGIIDTLRNRIDAIPDMQAKEQLDHRLDAIVRALPPAEADDDSASKTATVEAVKTTFDPGYHTTVVKAIEGQPDRFGGYAVVFTDASAKDVTGEYFTAETDFGLSSEWTQRPVLWHHAGDDNVKTAVGIIDRIEKDDVGVWAEGQYSKHNRYVDAVRKMVADGIVGYSSGAAPLSVRKARDGRINRWTITEVSMTPTPAAGLDLTDVVNMPTKGYLADLDTTQRAYKALELPTDAFRQYLPDEPPERAQESAKRSHVETAKAAVLPEIKTEPIKETKPKMDATEISAVAMELFRLQQEDTKQKAEATKAAELETVKQAAAVEAKARELFGANATKSMPNPQQAAVKTEITVTGGDPRFSDYSAADMSYAFDLFSAIQGERNEAGRTARNFLTEMLSDTENRSLLREISAKTIKGVGRNEIPASALNYLPFKSLDAVDANDYRPMAIKAGELDNTSATSQGVDWVPTIWSSELWARVRISNPFSSNVNMVMMPSNPFNLPVMSTDPVVYNTSEAADAADLVFYNGKIAVSQIKTGKVAITAKKLSSRAALSTEFNEDSIIPVLPDVRTQTIRALQNYIDDTIVNGDTATGANTNINLIDGTPAASPNAPAYTAFNGVRKLCLVTATGQAVDAGNAAPTLALLRKLRFTLAPQYAVDIPNLIMVCDVSTYQKLLNMPEFSTFFNVGGAATNLTGVLPGGSSDTVAQSPVPVGVIDGVRMFVSAQIGLAKSGAIGSNGGEISATPSNNTTGTVVIYHKTRFVLGYRRQIQVDTMQNMMLGDTIQLMASARVGLINFDNTSAATLYDINVT